VASLELVVGAFDRDQARCAARSLQELSRRRWAGVAFAGLAINLDEIATSGCEVVQPAIFGQPRRKMSVDRVEGIEPQEVAFVYVAGRAVSRRDRNRDHCAQEGMAPERINTYDVGPADYAALIYESLARQLETSMADPPMSVEPFSKVGDQFSGLYGGVREALGDSCRSTPRDPIGKLEFATRAARHRSSPAMGAPPELGPWVDAIKRSVHCQAPRSRVSSRRQSQIPGSKSCSILDRAAAVRPGKRRR
jgi:hypothetical protein